MDPIIEIGQRWRNRNIDSGVEIVDVDVDMKTQSWVSFKLLWDNTTLENNYGVTDTVSQKTFRYNFDLEPTENAQKFEAPAKQIIDNVNSPAHYKTGGIEVFDFIAAKLTPEELRGYCKGNCLKYLSREASKGGVEDLKKAEWYLKKLIEIYANA